MPLPSTGAPTDRKQSPMIASNIRLSVDRKVRQRRPAARKWLAQLALKLAQGTSRERIINARAAAPEKEAQPSRARDLTPLTRQDCAEAGRSCSKPGA